MAEKTITVNRKAQHDYFILERLEAGIALTGTEIKAIRDGRVNLRDAYARPERGEMWLVGAHIGPYAPAGRFNHEPGRRRKLLLHRKEILELAREVEEKGLTLVPLRLYLKSGRAKVELALARGKRQYDRRQTIARREAEREMQRALRHRSR
ncbi:MAG: SsrA-binding protein SmpB [Dehalococcoidia bacterium]|nr:SsrA-binding protein SmpB [Dehalococcoidia bacterium]